MLEAALTKALQLDSSQVLKVSPRQPVRHLSAEHCPLQSWERLAGQRLLP